MQTYLSKPLESRTVSMNGRSYAWDVVAGLDLAVVMEVEGFIRKKAWSCEGRAKMAGLEFEDLIQEGWTGALRAAAKFNPGAGAKYLTYAAWWIDAAMKEALNRRLVRTPKGQPHAWIGSLESPMGGEGEEEGPTFLDMHPDAQPGSDELSAAIEDQARVRALLPKLQPRDRDVLCRWAGLEGHEEQPIRFIAKDLGITRQRVEQILERIKKELRFQMAG